MSKRIELEKSYKLSNEDEKRIMKKINDEEFKLVSEKTEEDTYFSDKDLEFVKNRTCLRTRKTNDESLELTYKPKSTEESEKFGKREINISINVKDYEDIEYVIEQLGYIKYVSFKKHRKTYTKRVNGIERNIMIDEIEGIGKYIELEILSDIQDKEKMTKELEDLINEFECKDLEPKNMPYRDIVKKYKEERIVLV